MPAERFDFRNAAGQNLAALLDRPDGAVRAVALFAHCFTCGKSNRAARHIAEGLKQHGVAILRFDFTGLGASEGEFANTMFSSNVEDLVAAADHLRQTLVGTRADDRSQSRWRRRARRRSSHPRSTCHRAIGAPFDPAHVVGLFGEKISEIGDKDEIEVTLAGRRFRVRRTFLDDINRQNLAGHLRSLHKALLVFHSPDDDTVGIDNASHICAVAKHRKSFISLAGADYLLSKASDAAYVAHLISSWADRYLDMAVGARSTEHMTPPGVVPQTGDDRTVP